MLYVTLSLFVKLYYDIYILIFTICMSMYIYIGMYECIYYITYTQNKKIKY